MLLCALGAFHRDQIVRPVFAQRDGERILMRQRLVLGSWGLLRSDEHSLGQSSQFSLKRTTTRRKYMIEGHMSVEKTKKVFRNAFNSHFYKGSLKADAKSFLPR